MKLDLELDLEDLVVNGNDVGKKERRRIVRTLTGLPWGVYLKRRFIARRYQGRQHCVCLAISKAMAKHLAEIFNEELEDMRALAREHRESRRRK